MPDEVKLNTKRLIELREKMGLTKKQVSKQIGIEQSTYGKYELGHRQPSLELLGKLAEFFGVTTDYLLGRNDGETGVSNTPSDIPDELLILARNAGGLPEESRKALYEMISTTYDTFLKGYEAGKNSNHK